MRKDPDVSRRNFLKTSVIGAGTLAMGFGAGLMTPRPAHATLPGFLPCDSSHLLNVDNVRKYAWMHYHKHGGCMSGPASGLIQAFKEAYSETGSDWDYIPHGPGSWFRYGGGGIKSWGTLCGAVNGCIAVLGLINLWNSLAQQVLFYCSQTEFPTAAVCDLYDSAPWEESYAPVPVPDNEVLAKTVSNSPLCHNSVSKWCYAAGVNMQDTTAYSTTHKNDRCGKVCADVAAFTAELINYGVQNSFTIPPETAECIMCHHPASDTSLYPAQVGLMDCNECHTPGIYHAPARLIAVGAAPTKVIARNLRTRQTVVIDNPSGVFDCEEAGLEIQSGDRIDIIIKGTAD